MRTNSVETPPCSRDCAAVEVAAAGGDLRRGETVLGPEYEGVVNQLGLRAPRGEHLADPHGRLQSLQRGQTGGGARGGGRLRAWHALTSLVARLLRRTVMHPLARDLLDGLGRKAQGPTAPAGRTKETPRVRRRSAQRYY